MNRGGTYLRLHFGDDGTGLASEVTLRFGEKRNDLQGEIMEWSGMMTSTGENWGQTCRDSKELITMVVGRDQVLSQDCNR